MAEGVGVIVDGPEDTEDTEGVEDVEDMEHGGHGGHGGCGGQERSNIHNIVILCNIASTL